MKELFEEDEKEKGKAITLELVLQVELTPSTWSRL